MNSTLKNDILTSYRAGTTDIGKLAMHYGIPATQVERVIFPNGRLKKVLPLTVPKVAKVLSEGTFNGEVVRIAEVHSLKPRFQVTISTPVKIEVQTPITATGNSRAKSPEGRLGALRAWETMRERNAAKKGEIYVRKTEEELRKLAGFIDEKKEEEDPIVKVKPEAAKARVEQLESEGRKQEADRIRSRLTRHKDEELYVDSARIVETGRAVTAYCDHNNITPKQLIEAYEQLAAINKLLGKS